MEREGVATGFAPPFHRLEQEAHYPIYVGECHDVSGQGYKVARRTSISLHEVTFHANLSARERISPALSPCPVPSPPVKGPA